MVLVLGKAVDRLRHRTARDSTFGPQNIPGQTDTHYPRPTDTQRHIWSRWGKWFSLQEKDIYFKNYYKLFKACLRLVPLPKPLPFHIPTFTVMIRLSYT